MPDQPQPDDARATNEPSRRPANRVAQGALAPLRSVPVATILTVFGIGVLLAALWSWSNLLLLTFAAIVVARLLGRGLARLGLYRLVWHPPLFDACLFVITLACLSFLFTREF